jgi:hypothetical protein
MMPLARDEITEDLAERWCWQIARRDDARIARCLYRQQPVVGRGRYEDTKMLLGRRDRADSSLQASLTR